MEPILQASGLSKTFKTHKAVQDIDFTIERGQVYGLLGQNGAGKSTLIRMLLGLIFPDCGTIRYFGEEFHTRNRQPLRHVGAIIERPDMYNYLSGLDNLKIFAALSRQAIPIKRMYEVLEIVGLSGREKDKVKAYSLGMKQRLGLAIALIHNPELLILDEPTNGMDPQGISDMRELILRLSREEKKTILLSSHLLHEVEQIATHTLILHKGRKIKEGCVKDIINPDENIVEIDLLPYPALVDDIRQAPWFGHVTHCTPTKITLTIHKDHIPDINNHLVAMGVRVTGINAKNSLEHYFLNLTND